MTRPARVGEELLHGRRLTVRELQVVAGAANGLGNLEIGRTLFITLDTVKLHFRRALRKLGAADRAQAVVHAIGYGYLKVSNIDGKIYVVPGTTIPRQRGEHVGRSVA